MRQHASRVYQGLAHTVITNNDAIAPLFSQAKGTQRSRIPGFYQVRLWDPGSEHLGPTAVVSRGTNIKD